jgi:uncharacterized C2H2 Zn-finger protein
MNGIVDIEASHPAPVAPRRRPSTRDEAARTFLTLGDGDFSWSADLATFLAAASSSNQSSPSTCCAWPTNRLVATGIDALVDLRSKYTDYDSIVKKILRLDSAAFRVEVKHEINAIGACTAVQEPRQDSTNEDDSVKSDVVIFNHPHLGTEDAALHGYFLHHLFDAVETTWLEKHGIFIITLAAGQYERWKCAEAAHRQRFRLLEKRRFVPNALVDSVYELRRHQTGKSFRARTGGSFSFVYARLDEDSSIETIEDLPWFQALPTDGCGDGDIQSAEPSKSSDGMHFKCPYCDRIFREERSVENHITSKHKGSKKRKLMCTLCTEPRMFDCQEALRDHQQAKHQGMHDTIKPDWVSNKKESSPTTLGQCSICGIHFNATFGHNEHIVSFLPQPPRTFLCLFCSKPFGSLRAKKQHENHCSAAHDQIKATC